MEKILIDLYVPSIQKTYNLMVPDSMDCKELTQLLAQAVENLAGGKYYASEQEVLFSQKQQLVLKSGNDLKDYSIGQGDVLYLL